jgi:hypothetical protein
MQNNNKPKAYEFWENKNWKQAGVSTTAAFITQCSSSSNQTKQTTAWH